MGNVTINDRSKQCQNICNELAQNAIRNANMKAIVSLNEGDCIDWDLGGSDSINSDRKIVLVEHFCLQSSKYLYVIYAAIHENHSAQRNVYTNMSALGFEADRRRMVYSSWVNLREFLRREAGGCEAWSFCSLGWHG